MSDKEVMLQGGEKVLVPGEAYCLFDNIGVELALEGIDLVYRGDCTESCHIQVDDPGAIIILPEDDPAYVLTQSELERMIQLVYEELVDASVLPVPSRSALEKHVKSALKQLNKKEL